MLARLAPMGTHVVNMHEAKTRLSQLIRAVEAGDEVIVARHGHPVARLVPWVTRDSARERGTWTNVVSGDVTATGSDPDVVELFTKSAQEGPA